jgi:hypothetical protein
MNLQLPDPKSFGGAVLTGWTVASAGGSESLSGVIVVKAAYDLVDTGGAQRVMVRSSNLERAAIVYQDSGTPIEKGYHLQREADIALQKARVDIVVKGWGGALVQGQVRIDGAQWLFRAAAAMAAGDVGSNLFGWHSRTDAPRKIDTDTAFVPQPGDQLPPQYGAMFNNFYRRSAGFSAIAAGSAQALPSGKIVEIIRTAGGTDTAYHLLLPDLALKARLRAWCGDCEDEPKRWCIVDTINLVPDTLIVDPVAHAAEIVWRGRFDWTAVGEGAWRLAQVMEGSV